MNNKQEFIDQLNENGISFFISVPIPFGTSRIELNKNLVLEYVSDKYSALAKYYGVSKSDYVTWLEQNMSVQCCGTTTKDKRCKNVVTGGNHVSVQDWVKSQGSLCEVHEYMG